MEDLNNYQYKKDNGPNEEIFNYDYNSYEFNQNKPIINNLDSLSLKQGFKNQLLFHTKSNNNLNSNLNDYKTDIIFNNVNPNEYSSNYAINSKIISENLILNENNKTNIYDYDEEPKTNKIIYNNIEKINEENNKFIKKIRNKSLKINNRKYSENSIKVNKIVSDFEKALKQKEEAENKSFLKNIFNKIPIIRNNETEVFDQNDYFSRKMKKNIFEENKNFYNTCSKLTECSLTTNEILDTSSQIFDIENENKLITEKNKYIFEKINSKDKNKKNLRSKSTTKLEINKLIQDKDPFSKAEITDYSKTNNLQKNFDIYKNIKDLELIRDKLFIN